MQLCMNEKGKWLLSLWVSVSHSVIPTHDPFIPTPTLANSHHPWLHDALLLVNFLFGFDSDFGVETPSAAQIALRRRGVAAAAPAARSRVAG